MFDTKPSGIVKCNPFVGDYLRNNRLVVGSTSAEFATIFSLDFFIFFHTLTIWIRTPCAELGQCKSTKPDDLCARNLNAAAGVASQRPISSDSAEFSKRADKKRKSVFADGFPCFSVSPSPLKTTEKKREKKKWNSVNNSNNNCRRVKFPGKR